MTTPPVPMSLTQQEAITIHLIQQVPDLTYADARNILLNQRDFDHDISSLFEKYSLHLSTLRAIVQWQSLYRSLFRLEFDPAEVRIPSQRSGFTRLIFVLQGLTIEKISQACKERFPVISKYPSVIDDNLPVNERDPSSGSYAIWVRDCAEPDRRWRNCCADELHYHGIASETLLERHLHEIKFYSETGSHLDRNTVTR